MYNKNISLNDDIADYHLFDKKKSTYKNMKIWKNIWLDELVLNKLSSETIKSYSDSINTFLLFCKKRGKKILMNELGAKYFNWYLIDYQMSLSINKGSADDTKILKKNIMEDNLGRNNSNFLILEKFESSLVHRQTILKMFLKFITENNKEQFDYTYLFSSFAKIKISEKMTDYLSIQELEEIVEYMQMWTTIYKDYKPKSSLRHAYRDSLLLLLYALTGARSNEVIHIKLKDIVEIVKDNISYYIININKGKGGKKRKVAVKQMYIKKFIDYFKDELVDDNFYLSSTYSKKNGYSGNPITDINIRKFGNFILKILGINKSGLHTFRRGYVTMRVAKENVAVSVVAKEVGNTSVILEKHYLKYNVTDFL